MTCALCNHLTASNYCPIAADIVPDDALDNTHDCPNASPFDALKLTQSLIAITKSGPGSLLLPLVIAEDILSGHAVDDEHKGLAIAALDRKDRRLQFIRSAIISC